jgi:hypothetical protein
VYIFDLDNTLRDCTHRMHHISDPDPAKRNWKLFFADQVRDPVIRHTMDELLAANRRGHAVEIWSASCVTFRNYTEVWLEFNGLVRGMNYRALLLRPEGERAPGHVVKRRWLENAIAQKCLVERAFDDDPEVLAMYRAHGVPTTQIKLVG